MQTHNQITEYVNQIDARIALAVIDANLQMNALARTIFLQSESRQALVTVGSPSKPEQEIIVVDDQFDGQFAHILMGISPGQTQQWGTVSENYGEVNLVLLGMGTSDYLSKAYQALAKEPYVRIGEVNADSYSVLTGPFRLQLNTERNPSPALHAFSIRYSICQVAITDFLLSL